MREDIRLAPLAKKLGWTVEYDSRNHGIGKSYSKNKPIPTMPLTFRIGDKCLWLCREGWRSATLDHTDHYIKHKWEKGLEAALRKYAK